MDEQQIMVVIETALQREKEVIACVQPASLGLRAGANTLLLVFKDGGKTRFNVKFHKNEDVAGE